MRCCRVDAPAQLRRQAGALRSQPTFMKQFIRSLLSAGAFAAIVTCGQAAESETQNAAPGAQVVQAADAELGALVQKIQAKLQAGEASEALLADEIKGFDDILTRHAGEKTDAVAEVLVAKAMLYVQVLEDLDKALVALKRLAAEFPETKWGKEAPRSIIEVEEMTAKLKMSAALRPGAEVPDFAVTDTEGNPLSLARFKGKLVLVDFWATWCGPCVAEMPNVVAAYRKYHERGFEVIGVSLDKDEEAMKRFVKENKMSWPQFFDGQGWGNALAAKYGIQSIPATFLVDADGKIVAKDLRGAALEAELARRLEKK